MPDDRRPLARSQIQVTSQQRNRPLPAAAVSVRLRGQYLRSWASHAARSESHALPEFGSLPASCPLSSASRAATRTTAGTRCPRASLEDHRAVVDAGVEICVRGQAHAVDEQHLVTGTAGPAPVQPANGRERRFANVRDVRLLDDRQVLVEARRDVPTPSRPFSASCSKFEYLALL